MDRTPVLVCGILAVLSAVSVVPSVSGPTPPADFAETIVATGFATPLGLSFLPDGSGRLLVVQQAGAIRAVNGSTVTTLHTMTELNSGGERGLLGVAVDPDWPARPYMYVHYTANTVPPYVQVARFNLTDSGGILSLDPLSKLILIDDMPDNAGNHNGGTLRFAPDKTLYISVGDDAVYCYAQDLTVLAGKILRIRVGDTIDPANRASLAPPDNPFVGHPNDNAKLVWAYGLRNPFRFDIDPVTGDVFIGDVGLAAWEEVSLASPGGGQNFGWPYYEGSGPGPQGTPCPGQPSIPPNLPPIYAYPNPPGPSAASVIGAAVYRQKNFPFDDSFPAEYNGNFFFMEYYAGFLRVLRWNATNSLWDLVPGFNATDWGTGYSFTSDMVVGPDGALYYPRSTNVYRLGYAPPNNLPVLEIPSVTPTNGDTTTLFLYEVRYRDPDGQPPAAGHPRVHIEKGGVPIAGSPFPMGFDAWVGAVDDYVAGAIYHLHDMVLAAPGLDYSFWFDTYDALGGQTTTVTIDAPDVTAALPLPATDVWTSLSGGDVVVTWTLSPSDPANVDHYEVWAGLTYDAAGAGYGFLGSAPVGSAVFLHVGAAAGGTSYFYVVRTVNLDLSQVADSMTQGAKFSRGLAGGHELVSVPITPSDASTAAILQTVAANGAWTYEATDAVRPWKHWQPARGGTLASTEPGRGLWVDAPAGDFVVAGQVAAQVQVALAAGWNLVGVADLGGLTLLELKTAVAGANVVRAQGWTSAGPYRLQSLADGDLLLPGSAVWLYVDAAGLLTFAN